MMLSAMTACEKVVIKSNQDRRAFSRIPDDFGIKYKIISLPENIPLTDLPREKILPVVGPSTN